MVVVKVRETYDLATVKNKMTLISVHTPKPDIIKRNFPGLLMQCKSYRPKSCNVAIACASVLPLDPKGIGLTEDDVAPEDMFNPILYKAMSNVGLSQLEARITALADFNISGGADVEGASAVIDVDSNTPLADEFPIYYGLLSNAHGWKHASPQQGLKMTGLVPLVHELLFNIADTQDSGTYGGAFAYPDQEGKLAVKSPAAIRGNAKRLPFINCTSFTYNVVEGQVTGAQRAGFLADDNVQNIFNSELKVPFINCCVAGIIIPPSRLHQLFYRMVVEWEIEFSGIRPLSEIMNYTNLQAQGNTTHLQNYSYSATKEAITGSKESMLENDTCMVSANVDVKKVM